MSSGTGAVSPTPFRDDFEFDAIAAETIASGVAASGRAWAVGCLVTDGDFCLQLRVDGHERDLSCGFNIPGRTDIGFSASLSHADGVFLLYGLTSDRICTVSFESESGTSQVQTSPLPDSLGQGIRSFWSARPPVDDVNAIEGYASDGSLVQRLTLPRG